jgi:hypothetical protein
VRTGAKASRLLIRAEPRAAHGFPFQPIQHAAINIIAGCVPDTARESFIEPFNRRPKINRRPKTIFRRFFKSKTRVEKTLCSTHLGLNFKRVGCGARMTKNVFAFETKELLTCI